MFHACNIDLGSLDFWVKKLNKENQKALEKVMDYFKVPTEIFFFNNLSVS